MVSPSSRRRAVKWVVEEGLSNAAQACRALGLARSSYYLVGQKRLGRQKLERKIIALSEEHPRYGYRRITALMRRKGKAVNAKRVQRVRRQAGLQVKERQKRTRRLGPTLGKRLRAERANQVWSWDLLHDQTEHGRSLRILSLIDEYTKECLALQVGYSLRATDAIKVLEAVIARYGSPEYLRSDNGPEFIAKAIQDWTKEQRIGSIYITPGSPWEQAHIESFHDKLRDECLNRELFGSLAEARVILQQWRVEYNQLRPHSALGYQTPQEFAARHHPKWGVVSKDLNNPKRLFTPGPARADRLWEAVSPAPVDILEQLPKEKTAHHITNRSLR